MPPVVDGLTKRPSRFSAEPDRPTSLPSKYIAHAPAVLEPREVGVKAIRSSAWPEAPGTEKLPAVDTSSLPLGNTAIASTFSAVPDRPTSLPSKYMLQVPVVLPPRLEGL